MILVDDNTYYETLEILRGNKQLSEIFVELKEWLFVKYHIHAYNFEFKEFDINKPARRNSLKIMLSSSDEFWSMFAGFNFDNYKQMAIAEKFYNLAQKHNLENINTYYGAFVTYVDFSEEMRVNYFRRAYNLISKPLTEKYKIYSVWQLFDKFSQLTVFYRNEINVKTNQFIGISKQIKDEFYETLHRLDEFNVFTYDTFDVRFDSKENLDNKYEGNLFYYLKS